MFHYLTSFHVGVGEAWGPGLALLPSFDPERPLKNNSNDEMSSGHVEDVRRMWIFQLNLNLKSGIVQR